MRFPVIDLDMVDRSPDISPPEMKSRRSGHRKAVSVDTPSDFYWILFDLKISATN
jgi:hypothetical protein